MEYLGLEDGWVDFGAYVSKAKSGDKEALIRLVLEQKNDYYKIAYAYLCNKDDALDAVSEMTLILYDNIHKLRKEESFYSWSRTILINCCRKQLKRRKRTVSLGSIVEPAVTADFSVQENSADIEKYLSRLNPGQQEAIRLHYLLGWDYRTIANTLNIPEGTVKSRISIGLKKLKEYFGGELL